MLETFMTKQARALVFIALALALAGVVAAFSLPIGLFPQVSFPAWWSISIQAAAPPTRPPCW
jgi:multidrug efflux pump subunit AcrB